jgi:DNA repair photolyase
MDYEPFDNATLSRRKALKGRGALTNPSNRFDPQTIEAIHDGWDSCGQDEPSPPKTTVLTETSKTIITRNKSPDIPFDYSINPYRGCEHGCIYCYARPTHAYWDLSPGLDFETKIITKPDAANLLRAKLSQPGYKPKALCIGANTDPYQPLESELKITRGIIEVLSEFKHPFSIITKSALIKRDLDLLAPLAKKNLCSVAISVTTLDNSLKRILEPRTPAGGVRVQTIRTLTEAGIRVTLLAAPMIPYINDQELESILAAGKKAGAVSAKYILLRLPLEISPMFQDWLQEHFPDRAQKVMNIIRQSRGGSDYRSAFGERMRGTGHFADLLNSRWRVSSRKLGYSSEDRYELDYSQFKTSNEQLTLF